MSEENEVPEGAVFNVQLQQHNAELAQEKRAVSHEEQVLAQLDRIIELLEPLDDIRNILSNRL